MKLLDYTIFCGDTKHDLAIFIFGMLWDAVVSTSPVQVSLAHPTGA
jgi:hypothetical protein